MTPDDPRHGRTAGYDAHLRDGETACDACKAAAARYENLRRLRGPAMVDATGTRRRIQALTALGYTFGVLGAHLGTSDDFPAKLARGAQTSNEVRATTAVRVDALFRRLCMTPAPTSTPAERRAAAYARTTARKNGWAPPLAWDNIDDSTERPTGVYRAPTTPDAKAAERRAQRTAQLEHAIEHGHTLDRACTDLGITTDSLWRWCTRHDRRDLWTSLVSLTPEREVA